MCGIAGVVMRRGEGIDPSAMAGMSRILHHRGPDDRGYLLWRGNGAPLRARAIQADGPLRLGFVHCRLSIIDLSEAGWQPMTGANGRFDIILNGEIYNYIELREELARSGERFHSTSDTEVLLAAWSRWGEAALDRIVGMYAFAIVDWKERRLTLVRDCFGIKPLYYTALAGGIAFASEVKALLVLPDVSRRVAPEPLYQYLSAGLTDIDGETLLADIQQLPPATLMQVGLDDARISEPRRYWSLPARPCAGVDGDFAAASRRLRDLLAESVRLHLRSDVPVGALLSGGIDSSAIVALMREVGGARLDLHTFTYAADDDVIGEEHWADLAGSSARATMHKVRIAAGDLVQDIDELIAAQDLPFGGTSIYAQYRVFGAARHAGVKVMLDGQGADEMFGGYLFYNSARVASLIRAGRIGSALTLFGHSIGRSGLGAGRAAARVAAGLVPRPYLDTAQSLMRRIASQPWLDDRWFAARGGTNNRPLWEGRASLSEALATSFAGSNLPSLLRYEDRNSMVHSIESRVPFLTRSLVEFVFTLPEHFLIPDDGTNKSVLRAALRGLVPDAILDRRDKVAFATPEHRWLKRIDGWVTGVLASEAARAIPVLRSEALLSEWSAVRAGRRPFGWHIWRWLNLIRWTEQTGACFG
jgi:asparagine synthase (glutamine-hydrolysing)